MQFSIVIPTCNRNDLLAKCLDCLAPSVQTIDSSFYEVIVTDDGNMGQAKTMIVEQYSWVKWVEGPRKGPAANRNNGARFAKGKWLIFIDDDVFPDKILLQEYQNAIEHNPFISAFEGAILPDNWELLKKDMSECPINTDGNCFWSANISINAALFQAIGGFDEEFIIAAQEDQEIYKRIKILSDVLFLRQCKVVHPVRFTTLYKQILKIPLSSKNYCLFVMKTEAMLSSFNMLTFAISQYKFHIKTGFNHLKSLKIKSLIIAFCWILYGVPCNIFNLLRMKKKSI